MRRNEAGFVFFALLPHKRWIKYLTSLWRAAEPQNRAVDQIPQFAVRNSHFL
jgi:hypothetical protein